MTNQPTFAPAEEKLPLVPADITPQWLSDKLGSKVKSIEQTGAIWGTATKIFYAVTYEDGDDANDASAGRPTRICVKGGFNRELVQAIPPLIQFYRSEAQFYNTVAASVTHMPLPKVWWAGQNPHQGVIIMEDLNCQNYTFPPITEPWTVDNVKRAVVRLAALHASTWGASRAQYPWTTKYEDTIAGAFAFIDYNTFIVDPARPRLPHAFNDVARIQPLLNKYFASRSPELRCLVHGDAHVGNACFTPAGDVTFIDWQIVDSGSCFQDVSYFIASALAIQDRRRYELYILDHYLDALASLGGPTLSRSDARVMNEYKAAFLIGMGWALTTTSMQAIENIRPIVERFVAAWEDHNVVELVDSFPDPGAQ